MPRKFQIDKMHVGPLRRSLRKAISSEDAELDVEEEEETPFQYIVGKSIDKLIQNSRSLLENPDDREVLEIATRSLVTCYVSKAKWDIHLALLECESPIERIMLGALIAVAAKRRYSLRDL